MITLPTRPLMRYYGGKWKLAPWIVSHFPAHRCYVEPFGGAGSVLLRKHPARVEVYNDLGSEVVNLFRVLRNPSQASELMRLLALTPYSREEWLACYERVGEPVEQARRTLVLASMSHNPSKAFRRQSNGFRSSSTGYHMLPNDWQNQVPNLEAIIARLQATIIEHRDACKVMAQHDRPDTLHYVDPPYLLTSRADRRNLYQEEMHTEENHRELAAFLHGLQGYVVLSHYPNPLYEELFTARGWQRHDIQAVTGAAVVGKSHRTESIWLNPSAHQAQSQKKLF